VRRANPSALVRPVPLVLDRLRAADVGLVINMRDPFSVAVGAYYAQARRIDPSRILRVDLPVQPALDEAAFQRLRSAIDAHFDFRTQALALAWTQPYAVACNSLSGALALGFDAQLCANSCAPSRASSYANAGTSRPYTRYRMRLSMHLAGASVADAQALIDRGVAADGSLASTALEPAHALLLNTTDAARNVRAVLYPAEQLSSGPGRADVQIERRAAKDGMDAARLLLLQIGAERIDTQAVRGWLPGALADHLTSVGGALAGGHGQTTALAWLAAGATASHGAVSEPCNHLEKFPNPQWLLGHYLQGSTALEAYWKSVLWPQQSVFVGEPLAAPFANVPR
jgi:uncharacterized protein (TIGR03790 family)